MNLLTSKKISFFVFLLVGYIPLYSSHKPIIIYHAFDETFGEIIKELPELAKVGYSHIQVSPIQKAPWISDDDRWWRAYQPLDYVIEGKYGDKQQFKKLIQDANKYNISIIVDVVFSHIAGLDGVSKNQWIDAVIAKSKGDSTQYDELISRLIERQKSSKYLNNITAKDINPFRINYDHPYQDHSIVNKLSGLSAFLVTPHRIDDQPYAIFEDAETEMKAGFFEPLKSASRYFGFWFDDHPSINVSSETIKSAQRDYLKRLIKLGVKGFRFDALGRFPPSIWKEISKYLKKQGIWSYGEHLDGDVLGNVLYSRYGAVTDFVLYLTLKQAFSFGASLELLRIPKTNTDNDSVTWVETHDTKSGRENVREGLHGECIKDSGDRILALFYILARSGGVPLILNSDHRDHKIDLRKAIAFRNIMENRKAPVEYIENVEGVVEDINLKQNLLVLRRGCEGFMILNKANKEITYDFVFSDDDMNGKYMQLGFNNEQQVASNKLRLTIPARNAVFFIRMNQAN